MLTVTAHRATNRRRLPGAYARREDQQEVPCDKSKTTERQENAGYRNDAVYLRTSRYVPPRWEAVRDAMPSLFDLLEHEPEPGVRALLGHWLFGYVFPCPDGNGRWRAS